MKLGGAEVSIYILNLIPLSALMKWASQNKALKRKENYFENSDKSEYRL